MCVCQTNSVLYTASEHLYSVQSAVNDLMNVSDFVVMDTQELSIIGASALEFNSAKRGSLKHGNTVLWTWMLKETIINKLLVFERKILRKIFGPNNENGIWRIKTNQELNEIIKRRNIINFIRAQTLSWLGHIERMQGTRMVKAIYS